MPATADRERRKVLVSAYACEPGKGSEPGAGWLWALAAAKRSRVWVITRANNRGSIERDPASANVSLTFVYVDLPRPFVRWKRRGRWVRLYYVLWQVHAMLVARRLHARERFDVVHHVTFANIHLPALAAAVDAPFVLGPVAGGQRVAGAHYRYLGVRGAALESALLGARLVARANPLVRLAWRRAALILVNNRETAALLPRAFRAKAVVRPGQCMPAAEAAPPTPADRPPIAICSGRLHRFKGVELAIRAIAELPDWRLLVVGDGPDGPRLHALAHRLGVAARVEFVPAQSQQELWRLMSTCDAFLLPSLKEGGGFAAAEAAALGLAVVAFDQGGPAALAAYYGFEGIRLVPPAEGYRGLARELRLVGKRAGRGGRLEATPDRLAHDLDELYERAERTSAQAVDGAGRPGRGEALVR